MSKVVSIRTQAVGIQIVFFWRMLCAVLMVAERPTFVFFLTTHSSSERQNCAAFDWWYTKVLSGQYNVNLIYICIFVGQRRLKTMVLYYVIVTVSDILRGQVYVGRSLCFLDILYVIFKGQKSIYSLYQTCKLVKQNFS